MTARRTAFVVSFLAAGCVAPLTVAEPRDAGGDVAEVDGAAVAPDAGIPLIGQDATAADAGLDVRDEPDPLSDPVDGEADG